MASPEVSRWSSRGATTLGLLAIFLVSRLLVVAVAAVVERAYAMPAGAAGSSVPILRSLTTSDVTWFIGIARDGYHMAPLRAAYHDYVFFPLYPFLLRVLSPLAQGDLAVAGVAIANVSFAAALLLFERLSRPILGATGTLWAAAFLTLAPGSVAFSMAFADALFLFLALGATLAAQRRAYPLMAVLFGLAALTRLPGVVLIVPLAIALGEREGWRLHRAWIWLAAGPVALGGYFAYLWRLTGDPLAYVHAQAAWYAPSAGIGPSGLPAIPGTVLVFVLVAVVALYLFQFVYLRKSGIPRADAAYAVTAFASVAVTARIVSAPRYIAVIWPMAGLFVARRSTAFRAAALALFVVGYVGFAWLNFTTILAP